MTAPRAGGEGRAAGPGARFLAGTTDVERGRAVAPTPERMAALMARLGEPQARFATLHVTGTNGKTSTARYAAALLSAAGRRVGLYTSPHLVSVAERIELGGAPVDEALLEESLAEVAGAAGGLELTLFEAMTAAAFVAFARAGLELAVVEVGILGRHDPTNVVASEVAVVTNVGRDHLDYAGPEPGAVAREKAGIVKASTRACVLGAASDELLEAVESERSASGSAGDVVVYGRDFVAARSAGTAGGLPRWRIGRPRGGAPVEVALARAFEARNAATALVAAEALLAGPLPGEVVRAALDGLVVPGRAQVLSQDPLVVADVAHNPEAAATLRAVLDETLAARGAPAGPVVFVVGMTGARSPAGFLAPLVRPGDTVVACPTTGSPGAVDPAVVAADATALGAAGIVAGSVEGAVAWALETAGRTGAAVVVTGSFRVVAPLVARAASGAPPG